MNQLREKKAEEYHRHSIRELSDHQRDESSPDSYFDMFSKNKNLKKISFSLIASALFYVSILNHSKIFKSSSSTNLALLAKSAASAGAAGGASSGHHSSSSSSSYKSSRSNKKLFEQSSPTFTMIFLIVFYCFCSLCLVVNVNAQENIYYYTDGDAIQMQNNGANEDSHLETLLNKNFFSVFSSEMSILNSVENQSTNGHKLINNNNDNHQIYSSTSSGVVLTANQVPIANFRPAILDFKSQAIGIPKLETVEIHNTGSDALKLESISGNTIHFYCSFFLEKVIQPGGNTTFDVYFLARDVGSVDSSLYVNTNKGIIKYTVTGTGTLNPYRLRPIANARIPINSSFHSNIKLHNPHNRSMQILEVYTSDDDLHLELPSSSQSTLLEGASTITDDKDFRIRSALSPNKKLTQNDSTVDQTIWIINPYETKLVANLRYMGRHPNNHTSFICVKIATNLNISTGEPGSETKLSVRATNATKIVSLVLPLEVEVTDQPGIFSPSESINFNIVSVRPSSSMAVSDNEGSKYSSMNGFLVESNKNRLFELYVISNAKTLLTISEIYSLRQNSALKIYYYKGIQIPSGLNQLTKIAEILFDPTKSKKQSQNYGKILVKTNDTNISLKVNFFVDLHVGSLEYKKEQTMFLLNASLDSSATSSHIAADSKAPELVTQKLDLINNYQFPIVIHNVTLNDLARRYFRIKGFEQITILNGQLNQLVKTPTKAFEIEFNRSKYAFDALNATSLAGKGLTINSPVAFCRIHTNFTDVDMPLYIYDGLLSFSKHENLQSNDSDGNGSENDDEEFVDDFHVDILHLNSKKQLIFKIINPNPVDINFSKFDLVKLTDAPEWTDCVESRFKNTIEFKFLSFERIATSRYQVERNPPDDEMDNQTPVVNGTFTNEQIRDNIRIPAHHKMVIQLSITNEYLKSKNEKKEIVFSSFMFKYELVVATKYQQRKFKIEFHIVNGTLELRDRFMKPVNQIEFKSFPTQLLAHQFNLRSTFGRNLKINSVTFTEFGNAFTFKWNIPFTIAVASPSEDQASASAGNFSYQAKNSAFGQIQANETTRIGYVYFDPSVLCMPNCFLGFSRESDAMSSIESTFTMLSSKSHEAENDPEKKKHNQHLQMHSLWAKSFELNMNAPLSKNMTIFDLDSRLFEAYRQRWFELAQNQHIFKSRLRFQIEMEDEKIAPDDPDELAPAVEPATGTLEERQQKLIQEESNKKFLVYSFPLGFRLKWPHLIKQKPAVVFPLTQVNVASRTQNVTLYNPSNASVLIQIVLLRQYPKKIELLKLIEKNPSLFYDKKHKSLIKNLAKEHAPVMNHCRCQRTPPVSQAFKLKATMNTKQTSAASQRAFRTIQLLDMSPNKESLVMLLEPFQTSVVEIQFQPHKLGDHLDMLVVRNNLTIIDAVLLKGEGGSGELRINEMPPMRTSLFYDGYFVKSNGEYDGSNRNSPDMAAATAASIAQIYKTIDVSPIYMQMNEQDFEKCKHRQLEPIESMQVNTHTFSFFADSKEAASNSNTDGLDSPTEFVQGIVLRKSFEMKNVGTSDLTVFQIMFDGEPCAAYGFEITNCKSFTLEPNQTRLVEVKYHPDFTMCFINKRLTVNTNIGDLEYLIDVKIPYNMLTTCHDALPRPSLESHIFYLGLFIIFILIGAMILSSFAESRVLLKYESEIKKKINLLNDDNSSQKQEFVNELKLQRSFNIKNFLSSFDSSFMSATSHLSSNKPKQTDYHSNGHKSLAKASSTPRVESQPAANKKASLQTNSVLTNSKKKLDINNSTESIVTEQIQPIPKTFGSPKNRRIALSKQTSAPPMPVTPLVVNNSSANSEDYPAIVQSTINDDEPHPDGFLTSNKMVTFAKNISSTPSSATSSPRAIKNKLKQTSLVSTSNAGSSTLNGTNSSNQKSILNNKLATTEKSQRERDSNSSTPSPPPSQKNSSSLSSIYASVNAPASQVAASSPSGRKQANRQKTQVANQKSQPVISTSSVSAQQTNSSLRPNIPQTSTSGAQPAPKAPSLIKPGQNTLQFRELFLNKNENSDSSDTKSKSTNDSDTSQLKSHELRDSSEYAEQHAYANNYNGSSRYHNQGPRFNNNYRNNGQSFNNKNWSNRDNKGRGNQQDRLQRNTDLANLLALLNMNNNNIDLTQPIADNVNNYNFFLNLNDNRLAALQNSTNPDASSLAGPLLFDGINNSSVSDTASSLLSSDYLGGAMSSEQKRQLDQLNNQFLNIQRQKKQMERDSFLNMTSHETASSDANSLYSKLSNVDLSAPLLPADFESDISNKGMDFDPLSDTNLQASVLLNLLMQANQPDIKPSSGLNVPDYFSPLQSQFVSNSNFQGTSSNSHTMSHFLNELMLNSNQSVKPTTAASSQAARPSGPYRPIVPGSRVLNDSNSFRRIRKSDESEGDRQNMSIASDYDIIESNSNDIDDELTGMSEASFSNNESLSETPTSDIWILPSKGAALPSDGSSDGGSGGHGFGAKNAKEDADVDFDNLVRETAEFNDFQQKLKSLENNHPSGSDKPKVNSKGSEKPDKRSASRSYSMPFQHSSASTNSQSKLSSNLDSATQPKVLGPIQRPVNPSNLFSSSLYGDDKELNSSIFNKNLLWPTDNLLFSDLSSQNDPIAHLNLKSTNTSDDDLVVLSKDPSLEKVDSNYNAGLNFNEFRLFGNTTSEAPSQNAIGADLLSNLLSSTSSIWPSSSESLSNQEGQAKSSVTDKPNPNAPWNSILLDEYQCSPLAEDDRTSIKFDFPDTKSEDKLKSIWSDVSSSPAESADKDSEASPTAATTEQTNKS